MKPWILAGLTALAGCPPSGAGELGASCVSSEDCTEVAVEIGENTTRISDGECVKVDDDAFCFPRVERGITGCGDADDCIDAAFPIEARCVDGSCVCEEADCDDESSRYVAEKCACKLTSGEPCQANEECETEVCGPEGVCLLGAGEDCNRGEECASGVCDGDGPFFCT